MKRIHHIGLLATITLVALVGTAAAQENVTVNTGLDLYSRYVWRGLDIANTPSIQPALSVGYAGLELGAWGAYTLSNQNSGSDEIDFWLGYTLEMENGAAVSALVTDYYFPNAGIPFSNFNDYDAVTDSLPDPGAHTLEVGVSVAGPEAFPVTLSAYANVYNDAGNNTYFQVDYPLTVGDVDLGFFCGATAGSEDNPGYYGSDDFSVINLGVSASRNVQATERISLPLVVSLVNNPEADIMYLIVGMSL